MAVTNYSCMTTTRGFLGAKHFLTKRLTNLVTWLELGSSWHKLDPKNLKKKSGATFKKVRNRNFSKTLIPDFFDRRS